jgi:hypothetical protein
MATLAKLAVNRRVAEWNEKEQGRLHEVGANHVEPKDGHQGQASSARSRGASRPSRWAIRGRRSRRQVRSETLTHQSLSVLPMHEMTLFAHTRALNSTGPNLALIRKSVLLG